MKWRVEGRRESGWELYTVVDDQSEALDIQAWLTEFAAEAEWRVTEEGNDDD